MDGIGQIWLFHMAAVYVGFLWDQCIGDPRFLLHPVVLIGRQIAWLEQRLNQGRGRSIKGIGMVFCVVLTAVFVPGILLWGVGQIHPVAQFLLESFWCGQLLACHDLKKESMAVYDALEKDDLSLARTRVSYIVGRDTDELTEEGVLKATVETVAENTSDGVTAPLFYMLLFGCLGGFAYKAVNTMDSMVGYKNERFLEFGRAAAKLDDVCNFLPARLAALLMLAGAVGDHMDRREGWRIFRRDRFLHASPNSAQTEAACAGILGIQLAGPASYFGQKVDKPYIGESHRSIERQDIVRANRLLYRTAWLHMLLALAVQGGIYLLR